MDGWVGWFGWGGVGCWDLLGGWQDCRRRKRRGKTRQAGGQSIRPTAMCDAELNVRRTSRVYWDSDSLPGGWFCLSESTAEL